MHPDPKSELHPDIERLVKIKAKKYRTILRAYCNAGMPSQNLTPFGSFEGWSRLVREAIVWVGQPDPCETRARLVEQSDSTSEGLVQLLAAWKQYDPLDAGVVVAEMISRLYAKEYAPTEEPAVMMRAALENLVGAAPGRPPNARQVSAKLRSFRRRVMHGCFLTYNESEYNRAGAVWRIGRA